MKLLYENEGFTDAMFRTFLIYVASSGRPPHELLSPNLIELDQPYSREFEGMTSVPVPLDVLIETRARLIEDVRAKLDERAKSFLLGLNDCEPDFDAIGHPDASNLPAVRWKLINLEKLKSQNAPKHAEQREELLGLFDK